MCFSATASFIAGGSLTAIGITTLTQTTNKKQIPFASVPLLFGMQQIIEGVVWLSFGTPWLNTVATYLFVMFSHILWPIFLPLSVLLLEKGEWRRKILIILLTLGTILSIYIFYWGLKDSVYSKIINNSICYAFPYFDKTANIDAVNTFGIIVYILSTVGSCLISSFKKINIFGITLFISFALTYTLFNATLYSTWCFFAAILSVIIFWHYKDEKIHIKSIAALSGKIKFPSFQ